MRAHLLVAAILITFIPGVAVASEWSPVTASELAQKKPRVEPTADAEAIFWDVKIEDRVQGSDLSLDLNHYIRIKIFTERGKEKFATVEIEQEGKRRITSISGRTIKPDGTILDLKKDAIFDRQLAKAKGLKVRGKSFALPNVEVGDIIEYRYRETRDNELVSHMRLYFQRDIPMWSVTYHIKPLNIPYLPYRMRSMAFQCNHPPFEQEPNGFYATSMSNMPAFLPEPNMPPEDQSRAWMLIYYEEDKKTDAAKYWREIGRGDFGSFKSRISANNDVKRAAAELVSGAKSPEEKLALLDTFCRTKIDNLSLSTSRTTAEARKSMKDSHSPADTLKQKAGWGLDVDLLFAALANSAGFEARMARVPDRSDTFFSPDRALTYFLRAISVAVKVNDKWVFFDPATPYLEHGMLRWQEEGGQALVSDPKAGFFATTQFLQPARSLRHRRASFKLLDNGSLEGTVQYTYSGHAGRAEKSLYDDMTPAQREKEWKESLQARIGSAEISKFEMEGVDDPVKPLVVRHKVTVPGYAVRTGKRILLQPAFFEHNRPARFTQSNRKWPVYFDYGWAEDDEIIFYLPTGWELDKPVAPVSTPLADVGNYAVEVRKTNEGHMLVYRRKFDWGRNMKLLMPASAYSQIKTIFDFVQEQDNYTIAMKAVPNAN
jgi:hypothetical protein